jgi:maltooligosyltrehalose trehalohydrolase
MLRYGPEITPDGVRFRTPGPAGARLTLVLDDARRLAMQERGGDFEITVPGVAPGARYGFLIDDDPRLLPDPASRFQPAGPHQASQLIDPRRFRWRDRRWRGITIAGQVLYELHVGTFTAEGTWAAATARLPELAALGITCIEVMPVAEFPGRFGWGYDGVLFYAPYHGYGEPAEMAAFVDEAHTQGLAVILDVVFNHVGPDGNYLPRFFPGFFSRVNNDWGECIDYDGPGAQPVRDFMVDVARMWVSDYHLDGLRLDATQDIHDRSSPHILQSIVRAARDAAAPRAIIVIAENEPQNAALARAQQAGGTGCDALWNDDFHHAAMVAATGHAEAYYADTRGGPPELISALRWGYLFQGQYYAWQKKPRGRPALDLPASSFVIFVQNHDQIANSARGLRLHQLTSPGRGRALKALLLLAPGTPMLFQGEEWEASTPFLYFADHQPELATLVRRGRREFLAQFPSLAEAGVEELLADPAARATFTACQLDHGEKARHPEALALTRDLLALRRNDPVLAAQRAERMHGAVLGSEAFLLRHLGPAGDDRLILCNLGGDLDLLHCAEPLLAPPEGRSWRLRLSTDDPAYGGQGVAHLDVTAPLVLPGQAYMLLAATQEAAP